VGVGAGKMSSIPAGGGEFEFCGYEAGADKKLNPRRTLDSAADSMQALSNTNVPIATPPHGTS